MNIRKALTYIAFGFLFTLVNINLNFGSGAINITPDFIGWILFFLAYDKLGHYMEDRKYMKWIAMILAVATCALWIFEIARPEAGIEIVKTLIGAASAVYMFILFGSLEKIAANYRSTREDTIRILKYLNIVLYVGFIGTAYLYALNQDKEYLVALPAFIGLAALVAAIFTAFVLFALRKEIAEKEETVIE